MKNIIILLFALYAFKALSTTIAFPEEAYKNGNVQAAFEEQCSNGSLSVECQSMALNLKIEVMTLLPVLRDSMHPENVELYKELATLSDPRLKEMAIQFLRSSPLPEAQDGLFAQALKALFGDDSTMVNMAMNFLHWDDGKEANELADYYRRHSDTGIFTTARMNEIPFQEWWYESNSFLGAYHHPEEERFIGLDLQLEPTWAAEGQGFRAAKAYYVAKPLSETLAYFKQVTGLNPQRPLKELEAEIKSYEKELQEITLEIQRGNYTRMKRMQEIMQIMSSYSQESMRYSQLGLANEHIDMTTFLIPTQGNDELLEGAILLKEWQILQGTTIIYVQRFKEGKDQD